MKLPVVYLHGLARSGRSMSGIAKQLRAEGYDPHVYSYASRRLTIVEAAEDVRARIHSDLGDQPFHAVTHSLGGILMRLVGNDLNLQRMVMIAPPNQGCLAARGLAGHPLYRWFYGPAGQGVLTPEDWPVPRAPFAVIAGTRVGVNPTGWYTRARRVFGGQPNDGTLAVDETKLEGMSQFSTVPASHTFIMNHPLTRRLVLDFLAG